MDQVGDFVFSLFIGILMGILFAERGISNGQSNESINSIDDGPVAPPRKVIFQFYFNDRIGQTPQPIV